MEEKNEEKFS